MGQTLSFGLTQRDVDELRAMCDGKFSQPEIEALYKRFRTLDRNQKGFLTREEFLAIPELSINPLHSRMAQMFDNINFTEFVLALVAFSPKATPEDRFRLLFTVFDTDCDGIISPTDLVRMLTKLLSSGAFTEEELKVMVETALRDAGVPESGLEFEDLVHVFQERPPRPMHVDIPTEY
eukprot:jgi/Botrbrau1/23478/Bobra.106_1s0030.1